MECLHLHLSFVGYFTHDQISNNNRDYDFKYWKIYYFFQSEPNNYAYVTMTSPQRWHWALDSINNKISLLYSRCKIRSWSSHSRQFAVCQVNTSKEQTCAQLPCKQMSKICYKNIHTFLRYRNFRVGEHFFRFTLHDPDHAGEAYTTQPEQQCSCPWLEGYSKTNFESLALRVKFLLTTLPDCIKKRLAG